MEEIACFWYSSNDKHLTVDILLSTMSGPIYCYTVLLPVIASITNLSFENAIVPVCFNEAVIYPILGTLGNSENVAKKRICILSNLIVSIWTCSKCQMQVTFPGVEFLRILIKFKKRKENSSSYVHVLHKTIN